MSGVFGGKKPKGLPAPVAQVQPKDPARVGPAGTPLDDEERRRTAAAAAAGTEQRLGELATRLAGNALLTG
jgi:hypothetical protein